ncbi:MAG: hypothetical protein LBC95_00815 [Candidatus Nomurabacteria bacterium]|jgi:hypothetical protein|nr:hypothetical protein [Candidatus Nomurabacteria bacterium]
MGEKETYNDHNPFKLSRAAGGAILGDTSEQIDWFGGEAAEEESAQGVTDDPEDENVVIDERAVRRSILQDKAGLLNNYYLKEDGEMFLESEDNYPNKPDVPASERLHLKNMTVDLFETMTYKDRRIYALMIRFIIESRDESARMIDDELYKHIYVLLRNDKPRYTKWSIKLKDAVREKRLEAGDENLCAHLFYYIGKQGGEEKVKAKVVRNRNFETNFKNAYYNKLTEKRNDERDTIRRAIDGPTGDYGKE